MAAPPPTRLSTVPRLRAWAKKKWPRPVARATSFARMRPRFLVIGEMRCGTTSLFVHVCRHPDVLQPYKKELFYFNVHHGRGERWYRSHFPLTRRAGANRITGEATAYYLFHPLVPQRVHDFDPDMRLVALLRDPVERAYSHYQHACARGRESLSFEDALDAEEERLRGEVERIAAEPGYQSFNHRNHSYLARGRYADSLAPWLELFPREQLLVLQAEELFERPRDVVNETLAFLGLSATALDDYPALNTRQYGDMAPETRARLVEHFAEPNRRLFDLLGREFDWARSEPAATSAGAQ